MNLFRFYIILTILGVLLDILGLVMASNEAPIEPIIFCFVTSLLFLFFGIRGVSGKLKAYM